MMNETFTMLIDALNSTTAALIFYLAMVALALWEEIRERHRHRRSR
jgi:hypothetical protein